MDGPFEPAVQTEAGIHVADEACKDIPGAVLQVGNLPRTPDTAVPAVDDVALQPTGPGARGFKGCMEQSDVDRVLADTFALGTDQT